MSSHLRFYPVTSFRLVILLTTQHQLSQHLMKKVNLFSGATIRSPRGNIFIPACEGNQKQYRVSFDGDFNLKNFAVYFKVFAYFTKKKHIFWVLFGGKYNKYRIFWKYNVSNTNVANFLLWSFISSFFR